MSRPPLKVPVSVVGAGLGLAAICGWMLLRTAPAPKAALFGALAIGVSTLGLVIAHLTWQRSVPKEAVRLLGRLRRVPVPAVPAFLDRELAPLTPDRIAAVVRHLALYFLLTRDEWFEAFAESLEASASLFDGIDNFDRQARQTNAAAMERYVAAQQSLLSLAVSRGYRRTSVVIEATLTQGRLFAALLHCESYSHFGSLRARLSALIQAVEEAPEIAFLQVELLRDLDEILERLDPLSRLPNPEDRVSVLSQVLTQVLRAQDRLTQRCAGKSTYLFRLGGIVLESMRQLFTSGLEQIQRRASLMLELRSKVIATRREALVVLIIKNVGYGKARDVVIELVPSDAKFRSLRRQKTLKRLARGQAERVEFLIEPLVSDSVRLKFDVSYDDLENLGNQRRFFETVEFRQIVGNRAFHPLRPNPYIVGRPLSADDPFYGRDDVFARLESSLRGAHQDNVIVLIGPRRMGKTSILRRLHRYLGEDYVPVLIDLQGIIGSGEVSFFSELVADIRDELEEQGIEVKEPPMDVFINDPGYAFRRVFLKSVQRAVEERRLLLMFDELEVLEERICNGDLKPEILPYFRSLMQHEKNISFVFAGTHRLDELTWDYWGVLFNLAIYLEVGHLSEEELKSLLEEPTSDSFTIDPLALDKLWQLTNGHPYFSQLMARQLVDFRNHQQLTWITAQDVNAVANQVVVKGRLHMSYLFEGVSQTERMLVFAVEELHRSKGLATLAGARRHLEDQGYESGDMSASLKQLVRKNILAENGGMLTFRMELLRLWLVLYENLTSFLRVEIR